MFIIISESLTYAHSPSHISRLSTAINPTERLLIAVSSPLTDSLVVGVWVYGKGGVLDGGGDVEIVNPKVRYESPLGERVRGLTDTGTSYGEVDVIAQS